MNALSFEWVSLNSGDFQWKTLDWNNNYTLYYSCCRFLLLLKHRVVVSLGIFLEYCGHENLNIFKTLTLVSPEPIAVPTRKNK